MKCSDSLMWYHDRVGEVFDVLYVLKEPKDMSVWVRTAGMYNTKNYVLYSDCAEVNE
jgi:hypothetical protein